MAHYNEWNKAIAEYFVRAVPSGATVYLSVDNEALWDIGAHFEQSGSDRVDWVEDFTNAVRSECIVGNRVCLERVSGNQTEGLPRGVAFLAAMVLAAHRMVAENTRNETIALINYFTRLREVLGLPIAEGGRPEGLPAGNEENLWQSWNLWLIRNGWVPSAEMGQSNYNRYINYPLSQALLREGDKEAVEHFFRERENSGQLSLRENGNPGQLSRFFDKDTVGSWLRNQGYQFGSGYLRNLIQETDFIRYEAITDALYDVYTSIDWDQEVPDRRSGRLTTQRRLTAGLYRTEDPIMGTVAYWLYPRQQRLFGSRIVEVIQNGSPHVLRDERPGWYLPLWPEDPTGGVSYEVTGHPQIKEIILPERRFWILIRDPENETSGVFASWGHPGLGETFLLLCREEYADQMVAFKQEGLLNWDHDCSVDDEWVEYRECMILSPSWDGIIPERQDLYDTLKPNVSATISLKEGLRVSKQSGWLEDYLPEITIIGFDDSIELKIFDASCPNEPLRVEIVEANKPRGFPHLVPGDYLLEAYVSRKRAAQRVLRILPWDSLECSQPEQPFSVEVGALTLQGAFIEVAETGESENE